MCSMSRGHFWCSCWSVARFRSTNTSVLGGYGRIGISVLVDQHSFHFGARRLLGPAIAGVADPPKARLVLVHDAQRAGGRKHRQDFGYGFGPFFSRLPGVPHPLVDGRYRERASLNPGVAVPPVPVSVLHLSLRCATTLVPPLHALLHLSDVPCPREEHGILPLFITLIGIRGRLMGDAAMAAVPAGCMLNLLKKIALEAVIR